MRMNVSRVPSMAERGGDSKVMLNISLQAGKQLAQVMQFLGISSIRLSSVETMGSSNLKMDEVRFFDGVPQGLFKWSNNCLSGLCSFMEAFGILEVSLEPDSGDEQTLSRMWTMLENDNSQVHPLKGQRSRPAVPQTAGPVDEGRPTAGTPAENDLGEIVL
jgi:hypothetical protein